MMKDPKDYRGAYLSGADLEGADLLGADLTNANRDGHAAAARRRDDNMKYLESIDEAIIRAASVLDMEGIDDDKVNDTYEDIYHCGTCTVRAVMEIVYPSIEEYIEYLKL